MGTKNLGNVAGVIKGSTPPLESDGITEKRYVLWAKEMETVPISYQLMYYDLFKSGWFPVVGVSETDFNLLKYLIFGTLNNPNLPTEFNRDNLLDIVRDIKESIPDLSGYVTETTFNQKIAELVNGALADYDTFGEVQQKLLELLQADAGFVTLTVFSAYQQSLTNALAQKIGFPATQFKNNNYLISGAGNPLLIADIMQNIYKNNGALTSNRILNLNGFTFSYSNLVDRSNDASWSTLLGLNASGTVGRVNGWTAMKASMTAASDTEKDAWRLAQRKSTETYSTGQPRVDLISPINVNSSHNYTQYISVIGLNLYINTGESIVKLIRVKDENGVSITPEETLINASSIQTFSTNFQILILGINFFGKAKGYYKIYITSFTGLTNLASPEFLVQENFSLSNFNPVSFSVVDRYANSSDYVTSSEIYHFNQQLVGKLTLEKAVKSNVLFSFQNGFLYEFSFDMFLAGSYTSVSFTCGFSKEDIDININNGYTPQAYLGLGGDYGHRFINSVTYKDHNQSRGQIIPVKCIFFNKNGITTMIQLAPNGVVLVSSMVQNYNTGDPIRFYANFYSSGGGHGTDLGQNFKLQLPSTYQSF